MKRLLLTVCCTILISINSKAQLDTIPNAGFENWNYTPVWTIEAAGWHTNNSSIAAWNVIPDSVSHTGLLALQLIHNSYRGRIWSGFPIQNHPATLDGFVRNGLGIGDTAFIHIHVYSSNVIVDSGYAEIYGGIGSNYLPFLVNISQNFPSADSCVITLEGGNYYGAFISFDDLSFSFPTSVIQQVAGDGWKIFPNPVSDELRIQNLPANGNGSAHWQAGAELRIENIEMYNTLGKKVFPSPLVPLSLRRVDEKGEVIDISSLSPGTYILSVSDDKSTHSTLIIKQ